MPVLGMARPKLELTLTSQQQSELTRILKAPATPQKVVRRARIVQLAALGLDNRKIADQLQTSTVTVGIWRQRFIDFGIAGLAEASRPGRPSRQNPQKVRRALTEVVQPRGGRQRWSCRSMARHVGLSKDAVRRLWAANDIKPHRTRTFKLSNDREIERKFWDVIGLYLNPPTRALVRCFVAMRKANARLWNGPSQDCPWAKGIFKPKRTTPIGMAR